MSMAEPRIILWDIETTHNLAAVFKLTQNDYIASENIVQERIIVCAAWKELGKKQVHAVSTLDNPHGKGNTLLNDQWVCERLHEVLSSADVIVAHNGDEYDIKFTKGRMLVHGLPPLPPILSIDTLKVARKQFLLNANNLNYLGSLLGVGHKKPTKQGLWLKVLQGDQKAIQDMVSYNKQDVRLLERVFLKLQPHMSDHTNRQLFGTSGHGRLTCPRCGSSDVQSRGVHRAMTQTYTRYQCQKCTGWFRERRATPGTSTRTRVL
jgi:predicted RNA-binding Zn-ribbon protein involved in translation (DUF1610 family)